MQVFHIATAADWAAARRSGAYTTSTRGRTLEQEGFLHASRREQVPGTYRAFYADAREPLVLLTIDTDRLDVPWREDEVGEDRFPHIYGPLSPDAVVAAQPFGPDGSLPSFSRLFAQEMLWRAGLGIVAMLLAGLGAQLAGQTGLDAAPLVGALVGLALGLVLAVVVLRRRR